MSSPIEWLMDRELLRQFPQRYARAVDQRDHDALTALFDPDGSVDGTFGQQAVAAYLDTMGSRPDTGGTSMHVIDRRATVFRRCNLKAFRIRVLL